MHDPIEKCPICGGNADWMEKDGHTGVQYFIECQPDVGLYGCVRQSNTYATKREAIAEWNKRPTKRESRSEWVKWGGGSCPVDLYDIVEIDLAHTPIPFIGYAATWHWAHSDGKGDIICYRLLHKDKTDIEDGAS